MPLLPPIHGILNAVLDHFYPQKWHFLLNICTFNSNMSRFWTSFSLIVCQRNGSEKKASCVGGVCSKFPTKLPANNSLLK